MPCQIVNVEPMGRVLVSSTILAMLSAMMVSYVVYVAYLVGIIDKQHCC